MPDKTQVTKKEWQAFGIAYSLGKYPHERFGQAFLNHCLPKVTDSELFRQPDKAKARTMILEKYVNFGSHD